MRLLTLIAGSAALLAPATQRPVPPSDARATLAPGQRVRLTWRDSSSDEDEFLIEHRSVFQGERASFRQVARLAAGATEYLHLTEMRKGEVGYFRVRARNRVGDSPYSNTAVVRR